MTQEQMHLLLQYIDYLHMSKQSGQLYMESVKIKQRLLETVQEDAVRKA